MADKLSTIRSLFNSPRILSLTAGKPLSAYILPSTDAHNSEYLAEADFRVKFLSGFTGSNAYVLVGNNSAHLWTDGRYFVQAEKQLAPGWTLQKQGVENSITPTEWLLANINEGEVVGFDPELISYDGCIEIMKKLSKNGIQVVSIKGNIVDDFWNNRPKLISQKLMILSDLEAGQSVADKIQKLRDDLRKKKCTAGVFATLDDIMWILNVRGSDIPHNPLAYSYFFVDENSAHFFIANECIDEEITKHLNGVTIHNYADIIPFLQKYYESQKDNHHFKIFFPSDTNYAIGSIFSEHFESDVSPIQSTKAVKNPVELQGMRDSNIRDSAALVEFLYFVDNEFRAGKQYSEIELAQIVDKIRSTYPKYVDLSFATISAGGDHSALPHYHAEGEDGERLVHANTVFLVDSGAQYRDGTTDVTRTVFINTENAPKEFIDHNTLVLKGHITLANTKFPSGIPGVRLDTLSRHALWQLGLDFGHGTGHGVGHFLNVHEGPVGIGHRLKYAGISAGMILTIEPGYYLPGSWGIRIENVYEVVAAKVASNASNFLEFRPLTWVPIQTSIINKELLTQDEINWFNDYHTKVLAITGKYLQDAGKTDAYNWLINQCKHL